MKLKKIYFFFLTILLLNASQLIFAQQNITVTVKENQTIRSIANEHLGDSNLWEDILRANKLASPADIKTGTKLIIPVASIKENQEALTSALTAINEASKSGAKLFAEESITNANNLYEQSVAKRKEGKRDESTKLAKEAKDNAERAIVESQKISKTPGTALLSYKKGNVENRKPAELTWNEAALYEKLFEHYRTRTLSNSYAEIAFKDLSKIRLYENSQAVIQSSRVDLLKNQRRASVNLEKGEAYALLLGNGKKKDFNFNIPGIDTKINSKLFWVQKENKETKIANYNGEIEVAARDSLVVIRENEGSVVPDDGVPSEPQALLPAPGLLFPEFEKTFYVSDVSFKWSEIPGAAKYSFIISGDRTFDTVVETNKELYTTEYQLKNLTAGIYYWRVAAVDKIGLPGPFSKNGFFIIREDKTPPYLIVDTPAEYVATKENKITISGSTETGIFLFINEKEIETDSTGRFETVYVLHGGFNKINIKAIDLGNNETIITRNVIYELNPDVEINFSGKNNFDNDNNIVSTNKSVTIYGTARPKSVVKVFTKDGISILKTFADDNGEFEFLLSNINNENNYELFVETPAGYKGEKDFTVLLDPSEPVVFFDNLPYSTSQSAINISGNIINTTELFINNKPVTTSENNFSYPLTLKEGENNILIEAKNKAGYSRTIERNIFLDNEAPLLKNKKIQIEPADNFEIIKIRADVFDKSELKRTAQVEYELNGEIQKAYLRLAGQSNTYEGNIQILKSRKNNYKIISITLEDYLGNRKSYNF